ncbi:MULTISPECIES: hypothetical protein [unclassified Brucella]|nr:MULTISPECIES: hypothetical protein [unclassified Brucella]
MAATANVESAIIFVGDDDRDQEIAPVPVLPKAHKEKEHGGDGKC